jgi:hypothetical protein
MDEQMHNGAHGHEETDVRTRPLMAFFVVFFALMGVGFLVAKWSYDALVKFENARQKDKVTQVASPASEIPESLVLRAGGPQVTTLPASGTMLQPDPVRDMDAMRAEQTAKLGSYGWVDREKGIVHIPVDKAMALALERSMVKAQSAEPSASVAPADPKAAAQAAAPAAR